MTISSIKRNVTGSTPLEILETNHLKTKRKRLLSLAGFTLLETAVAVFISILVITSSLYALNRGMSLIQTAKDMNIALNFARSACEEIRKEIDSTGQIVSRSYSTSPPNDNYSVTIEPEEIMVSWDAQSQRQRSVVINLDFIQRRY
jgi:type II secretory pathway pseudopilin PulG